MSALSLQADPVPLRTDEYGAIRVGNTRILLDLVIEEFELGASPEEIVTGYPVLNLGDVYAVIAYYLGHREAVDRYLQDQRAEAERLRQGIEAQQPDRAGLRAKLLARRAQREQEHAAPAE